MRLFGWISRVVGIEADQSIAMQGYVDTASSALQIEEGSFASDATFLSDDFDINPANGLPMCDGIGSLDVMGNVYGTDWSDEHLSSSSFDID